MVEGLRFGFRVGYGFCTLCRGFRRVQNFRVCGYSLRDSDRLGFRV